MARALLLLLACVGGRSSNDAIDDEKALLMAFKASFSNGEDVLPSWTKTTSPCDGTTPEQPAGPWKGVTCRAGRPLTV